MSKYDALGVYLREKALAEIPMTFAEIERVTGHSLPPKAQNYPAWWSNNPSNNVMTKVWLTAGYKTEQVDIGGRKLVFRRVNPSRPTGVPPRVSPAPRTPPMSGGGTGMSDVGREFGHENMMTTHCRHPAWGALKGTFAIEPGWDLTRPALDPEELAEWDASLERKADMIEAGMGKKKP